MRRTRNRITQTCGHLAAPASRSCGTSSALPILSELKPVPIDEDGSRLVSLAFIFIVSSQIILGWEFGVLIGAVSLAIAQLPSRTPLIRSAFNTAVYALAAVIASVPWFLLSGGAGAAGQERLGFLTALSFVEGALFVAVNVALVCLAIALFEGVPTRGVLTDHLRHSGPAFVSMVFIAALTVALWTVWPPLLVLLTGPLFALALFQRYALSTKVALRAAATDSLTTLKNTRSYEADIAEVHALSTESGTEFALCLLDIDDFKRINDRHGHQVGDDMLVAFGRALNLLGDDAAPLGGDEFALVGPGGTEAAVAAVEAVRSSLDDVELP